MLVGLVIMQAAAAAAPPPAVVPPRLIEKPRWVRQPKGEDFWSYYPSGAQRELVAGVAMVECIVEQGGELEQCIVLSEDPVGYGFAAAAAKLAKLWRVEVKDETGQSTIGGRVKIPVTFRSDAGQVAPIKVQSQAFAGHRAVIDCRIRGGVADNCIFLRGTFGQQDFVATARNVGPAIKFDPSVKGRFTIRLEFVAP
jgi:TonB family protein